MNKDDKSKNVIVMADPVVVEWKVRLIEQFFQKSTPIKSYEHESPKAKMTEDIVSSILEEILLKVDFSIDQGPKESEEMNVNRIQQSFSLSENSENKSKVKSMEMIEVVEFNEYNYWKIQVEIQDDILSEAKVLANKSKEAGRDKDINEEMAEYNDSNWWKPNEYIKVEIENYELEVGTESSTGPFSFIEKPLSKQESDSWCEISKFNEFNFWKLDMSPVNVKTEKKHPNEKLTAQKSVKKDDQIVESNPMHKSRSSVRNKRMYKSKPKQRSQSRDPSKSSGRIDPIFKSKPNQRSQSGDQSESSSVKKPMSSVVMVYNLNPSFMDCDRLFNLISPYAKVQSIKFLKQTFFRTAMVELYGTDGAKRVLNFLNDITIFGKHIKFEPSSKNKVTEFNPESSPLMPNGAKCFKDFSQEKFSLTYHSTTIKHPPTRTLFFYQTQKLTDDEFFEIFEKLKAPCPYIVMWFPNQNGMGCLQFNSKREALEAICMTNLAMTNSPGQRLHLAFTYAREDHQFYCGKKYK